MRPPEEESITTGDILLIPNRRPLCNNGGVRLKFRMPAFMTTPLSPRSQRPPNQTGPWENGYNESFNGKLRDELLNGEIFYTLKEAQVLIERWRQHYNTIRPHSSLGYRPPAPETVIPESPDQVFVQWATTGSGLPSTSSLT